MRKVSHECIGINEWGCKIHIKDGFYMKNQKFWYQSDLSTTSIAAETLLHPIND